MIGDVSQGLITEAQCTTLGQLDLTGTRKDVLIKGFNKGFNKGF